MKRMVDFILLVLYAICMYLLWKLCQLGSMQTRLTWMLPFVLLLLLLLPVKLKLSHEGYRAPFPKARLAVFLIVTALFGGLIAYTGIPYHGKLAWKIQSLQNHRTIKFVHSNLYEDGIRGMLKDVRKAVSLPEELYLSDNLTVIFRADGTITDMETMLCGQDASGKIRTFLLSYNAEHSDKLDVWINRDTDFSLDGEKALSPLFVLLDASDFRSEVETWYTLSRNRRYGIFYSGRRTFHTDEGLRFLEGDADGDGRPGSVSALGLLSEGGEIRGYAMSLYLPDQASVTPIRYLMEPEYISQHTLDTMHDRAVIGSSRKEGGWTTDDSNGTVYTFVPGSETGYRLIVTDAAAGSRFYELEKTEDGGSSWRMINENPFVDHAGVAEGIEFFTEELGFIGLQGASGGHSQIFVTRDGGGHFEAISLPMDQVKEVPEPGKSDGLTRDDYQYLLMPTYEGKSLSILVTPGVGETEGILFRSDDNGTTWKPSQ